VREGIPAEVAEVAILVKARRSVRAIKVAVEELATAGLGVHEAVEGGAGVQGARVGQDNGLGWLPLPPSSAASLVERLQRVAGAKVHREVQVLVADPHAQAGGGQHDGLGALPPVLEVGLGGVVGKAVVVGGGGGGGGGSDIQLLLDILEQLLGHEEDDGPLTPHPISSSQQHSQPPDGLALPSRPLHLVGDVGPDSGIPEDLGVGEAGCPDQVLLCRQGEGAGKEERGGLLSVKQEGGRELGTEVIPRQQELLDLVNDDKVQVLKGLEGAQVLLKLNPVGVLCLNEEESGVAAAVGEAPLLRVDSQVAGPLEEAGEEGLEGEDDHDGLVREGEGPGEEDGGLA